MALTKSKASSIFTPEGNSLAVFIDVVDGAIKLKDVFGDVVPLTEVLNLTELTVDKLAFNTSYVYPSLNTGEMAWNDTEKTVDLRMGNGGGVTAHLGQSLTFPLVVNKSGGTLIAGTLVMVDPTDVAQGNRIRVVKAVSDGTYPVELMVGILNESIDNNQEGFATWFGYARDLSLTALEPVGEAWAEGDILYANPSIAGGLTKNKPNEPNWDNTICAITSINGVNLTLLVRPSLFVTTQEKMLITERLKLGADSTATTQTTAVIQATDTNSGIALVPNGTGAITAQVPDGTIANGNARGEYAVDLQRVRSNANQVASGNYSVISGGLRNKTLTNQYGFIGGGYENTASGNYSVIAGGSLNSVSGFTSATICGGSGNNASAVHTFIGGGQFNTASTGTHATVVGGYQNTSSGQYSVSGGYSNVASGPSSIALGYENTASIHYCTVSGGRNNTASTNFYATVLGGLNNISEGNASISGGQGNRANGSSSVALGSFNVASASYSMAIGYFSEAYLYGQKANSAGRFITSGDAQESTLLAKINASLTTGATTVLSLDGTGTTNLIIPNGNNRAWNVTVEYVGVCTVQGSGTTVVGDVVTGTDKFRFKRVGGTSTIGAVTNIELTQDATMTSAECTYAVGGSNDLQITFVAPTTANATTFRVVAKVSLVEVAW